MAVNMASKSIQLPDEMAKTHEVLFAVHTTLAAEAGTLQEHLQEHLHYLGELRGRGLVVLSGPFFTPEGKNSGNGLYILKADSLREAQELAAEDPMHKLGVRTFTVQPLLRDVS